MNITEYFAKIAMDKVIKTLSTWKGFQEVNFSFTITAKNASLSPEIVALGGKMEHWESEESGVCYLAFDSQDPSSNSLLGRDGSDMLILSIINGEQHILRITEDERISIVMIENLPGEISKKLEKLALSSIMYAAIENLKE